MFLGVSMKSIKNKLLTGIILINSMMLVGILIFTINFKDIYIKYTSLQLDKLSNEIKVILNENLDENTSNKLLKLTESKGVNLDIYNKEGNLAFKNRMSMNNHMMGKMKNKYEVVDKYYINRDLTSYIIHENSENIEFLSIISSTHDNLYTIVIKTPISSIENSIKIASTFLIIIFIPIIIISIIMAIIFSIKFTKPIRKLNEVTDKISNLDFNERVDIKTNDEIEKLGQSINKLSDKINSSLNDLKYKNDELEVLIKNKEKQENLRREFVSSVSHELKTPITVISGYALGLKSNVAKSYEDREYYIDVIYEESEKMGVLVKDLLDLYKLESKTFSIKKEQINIKDLIIETIRNFEIKIKEKDINVTLNINDIYIYVDKIRIQQVLYNFIDNAIHHIDNKRILNITTYRCKENLKVSIYNSGENIEDEYLDGIWDSFMRINKSRTYSDNRVGLGLSIIREIINLHDGKCGVLNKKDGVEFWFELKL